MVRIVPHHVLRYHLLRVVSLIPSPMICGVWSDRNVIFVPRLVRKTWNVKPIPAMLFQVFVPVNRVMIGMIKNMVIIV